MPFTRFAVLAMLAASAGPAWADSPPAPRLGPAEAVTRALAVAPAARAAAARLRAAEAESRQAGALPNPELSLEAENFGGDGPYRGARSLETTIGLSQRLELGGQRAARTRAAEAAADSAGHGGAAARLELERTVRKALTEALAAAEEAAVAADRLRAASETERAVAARVEAGREAPLQTSRAQIARRQAEAALARSQRREHVARQALASLLALDPAALRPDDGWFRQLGQAPAAPGGDGPDLRQLEAEAARGRAVLDLERRAAVPDVTLSAGVRRFRDNDETALIAGVSVPLPLFDRNRGAIERARAEAAAAEADLAAARQELASSISAAQAALETAREQAGMLQSDILPAAEEALRLTTEGYALGKFGYLEVLEAQRTLFDARADLTNALQAYHDARADLDRLTGTSLAGETTP